MTVKKTKNLYRKKEVALRSGSGSWIESGLICISFVSVYANYNLI